LLPLQAPAAVHAVAWVDVQVKVEVPPALTVLGVALKVTVGAVAATVTVAVCDALPPRPLHVNPKVELALMAPVVCVPFTLLGPDQFPEAVQAVAFTLVQVSEETPPAGTVLGLAERVTWGAREVTVTVVDCEAEPPGPVQVISNSVSLERWPVDQVPLVARAPVHPPVARHWVAFCVFQVRVDMPSVLTVVGEALKVMEGAGVVVTVTCRDWVVVPLLFEQVRV
jgi:hypothetical protein